MSIETNNVSVLPGMIVSGENLTPSNTSDKTTAFTATLQAQLERLNTQSYAPPNPMLPEQSVTMPSVDLKTPVTMTLGDNLGITLQTTPTAEPASDFPSMLLDEISSPTEVITEAISTEAIAERVMPQQPAIKNTSTLQQRGDQTLTSIAADLELIMDATNEITPANNVTSTDLAATEITTESSDTFPAVDFDAALTKPNTTKPVTSRTPFRQTTVIDQNNPSDTFSISLSELLKSSGSVTDFTDSPKSLSASTSENTEKPKKTPESEDTFESMVLTIQPQSELPLPIQPDSNGMSLNQPHEAAVNTLVQTGLLKPPVPTQLNTAEPKNEPNAPILATSLNITKTLSAPLPPPSTSSTEAKVNDAFSSILSTTDAIAPKITFPPALDNLKASDDSSALEAGLAKSLANLGSELAAFERPLNNALKLEVPAMTAHLYSPDFNEELGTKIMWMTSQKMSSAELTLNPPHLGPVSVHIDLQQDQASVAFTTHNAGVKEMLEASIPKLREMLQTQNLTLNDVNVSQQSFLGQGQAQSPNFGQNSEGQKRTASGLENAAEPNTPVNEAAEQIEQSRTVVSNGLVSLYA